MSLGIHLKAFSFLTHANSYTTNQDIDWKISLQEKDLDEG